LVHNTLVGVGLRDRIRLGASGKIISGFDVARTLALGADWCNSARGFMFALGCIQAQTCHTGNCPTGVTTQDPQRQMALVVPSKAERVKNFHHHTLESLQELMQSAGIHAPSELDLHHIERRISEFETQRNSEASVAHYNHSVAQAQEAITRCRVPVVAAISGICYGGGLGLALSCDLRYANPAAKFRMPAARLGLGYGYRGMKSIVQNLGPTAAAEAFYTAKVYGAADAAHLARQIGHAPNAGAHRHDIAPTGHARRIEHLLRHRPVKIRAAKTDQTVIHPALLLHSPGT
jgi:hypothetical protein